MQEAEIRKIAFQLVNVFTQFRGMHWKHTHEHPYFHREMILFHCIINEREQSKDGLMVSELSRMLGIKPPSVTQMINSLEDKGLVERNIDPADRRAVRVRLTQKGLDFSRETMQRFVERIEGLVRFLGEEDAWEFIRLLGKSYDYFISDEYRAAAECHKNI